MKILYTHLYDSAFGMGGAEKVVIDIIRAIKKEYGAEIACCVNDGHMSDLIKQENIPIYKAFYTKSQTFRTLRSFNEAVDCFEPNVIHSHHRFMTFLASKFFKKKAPVLHTEHVLRYDKKMFFCYGSKASAVSESVRQNLIHTYHVPERDVVTIPNGVVLHHSDLMLVESLRQQYHIHRDRVTALVIGRLEEQKGHIYLIEALNQMSTEERQKLHIFLAGDGKLEESLKAKVHEYGLESVFTFLGHTDCVPEFLSLCDFVILPSLWEGMPLSILEAYSAAKPVLATRIPGTSEVMLDGVTGYLVEDRNPRAIADGLRRVLAEPDKVSQMGKNAYECWKATYAFDKTVASYWAFYQELAQNAK